MSAMCSTVTVFSLSVNAYAGTPPMRRSVTPNRTRPWVGSCRRWESPPEPRPGQPRAPQRRAPPTDTRTLTPVDLRPKPGLRDPRAQHPPLLGAEPGLNLSDRPPRGPLPAGEPHRGDPLVPPIRNDPNGPPTPRSSPGHRSAGPGAPGSREPDPSPSTSRTGCDGHTRPTPPPHRRPAPHAPTPSRAASHSAAVSSSGVSTEPATRPATDGEATTTSPPARRSSSPTRPGGLSPLDNSAPAPPPSAMTNSPPPATCRSACRTSQQAWASMVWRCPLCVGWLALRVVGDTAGVPVRGRTAYLAGGQRCQHQHHSA
jgi:hypothetical protein